MNIETVRELVKHLHARDAENMNLDAMVSVAVGKYKDTLSAADPLSDICGQLCEISCDILRIVGPAIFEAAYYAGAAAGMEISKEIRR